MLPRTRPGSAQQADQVFADRATNPAACAAWIAAAQPTGLVTDQAASEALARWNNITYPGDLVRVLLADPTAFALALHSTAFLVPDEYGTDPARPLGWSASSVKGSPFHRSSADRRALTAS